MGIADQFKDKAQELADQAKQQKKAGGRRDERHDRPSDADEQRTDRAAGQPGVRERAQGPADQARERSGR